MPRKELSVVAALVTAAAVVAGIREYPAVYSDRGVFLSVMSALARGQRLYRDVFDDNDPLFYYAGAGAVKIGAPVELWVKVILGGGWRCGCSRGRRGR